MLVVDAAEVEGRESISSSSSRSEEGCEGRFW